MIYIADFSWLSLTMRKIIVESVIFRFSILKDLSKIFLVNYQDYMKPW